MTRECTSLWAGEGGGPRTVPTPRETHVIDTDSTVLCGRHRQRKLAVAPSVAEAEMTALANHAGMLSIIALTAQKIFAV